MHGCAANSLAKRAGLGEKRLPHQDDGGYEQARFVSHVGKSARDCQVGVSSLGCRGCGDAGEFCVASCELRVVLGPPGRRWNATWMPAPATSSCWLRSAWEPLFGLRAMARSWCQPAAGTAHWGVAARTVWTAATTGDGGGDAPKCVGSSSSVQPRAEVVLAG